MCQKSFFDTSSFPLFSMHLLLLSLLLLPAPAMGQDSLTILFAGDAMMHQTQIDHTREAQNAFDLSRYFVSVEREIKAADIAVVNFEVTLGGKPYNGYPVFSAPEAFAVALQDAGFGLFLLANNHCLDKGAKGLVRTLHVLDSLEIKHTGTFLDTSHRMHTYPLLLRKNGFRIILLNYTYDTNGIRVSPPGIVNYIDKKIIAADIAEAKLFNPDFIIANMHWGLEYNQHPSKEQRSLADWLLQQGADLVIGSHPHVVQPVELRRKADGTSGLVAYSLGNFISNMQKDHTNGGMVLKVVLCRKGLRKYISSARYGLVFSARYQNRRGKEDLQVIPAVSWFEKQQADSLYRNPLLERFILSTRTFLNDNNIAVEEYVFE